MVRRSQGGWLRGCRDRLGGWEQSVTKTLAAKITVFAVLLVGALGPPSSAASEQSSSQPADSPLPAPPTPPSDESPEVTLTGQPPSLFASELEDPQTLGIGRVAKDVAKHLPALEALTVYLGDRLSGLDFVRARPVIARNNDEMMDFLRRGIVDVVSETPLSAIHFVQGAGARIILRERRNGRGNYRSILFVRSESPLKNLTDLRGRRVAFEDSGSTTAFLLPLASIKQSGLAAVELSNVGDEPPKDAVGYFFTRSESAIFTSVARGVTDAGALSDDEWRELRSKERGPAGKLRVLYESRTIPRAFALTGPTLSENQRTGVRDLLLSLEETSSGRAVLQRYNQVEGFDPIDAPLQREIDGLQTTYALVRQEIH